MKVLSKGCSYLRTICNKLSVPQQQQQQQLLLLWKEVKWKGWQFLKVGN